MQNLIKNPLNLNKVEFWAATCFYVISIFVLVTYAMSGDQYYDNGLGRFVSSADFIPLIIRYSILYTSFIAFNFWIVPSIIIQEQKWAYITFCVMIIAALGMTLGVTDTYLRNNEFSHYKTEDDFYNHIFLNSYIRAFWITMMFAFYVLLKQASSYLLNYLDKVEPRYYLLYRQCVIAFIAWMACLFILIIIRAENGFITFWIITIPYAIGLYWFSFYNLFPRIVEKNQPLKSYLWQVVVIVVLSALPIGLIMAVFNVGKNTIPIVIMGNTALQLLLTMPLTFLVYKQKATWNAEVFRLKTELGQSNANYNLLQSQINPHFLFNALNTLFGTALQENAERTGEGIQKLGDMMRFMLHENVQEKISLAREVDYLNNYISFQKLRTQSSPDIVITTEIENEINVLEIAPMLLIPFVENAFKHGISLREPSFIKITLHTKEHNLYFDVHNSIHVKPDSDPEKNHSGIGLNNVKQRLKLLYAKKHELIIRETGKEFFVHLTLELNSFKISDDK